MATDCVFCKIATGEIPSTFLFQSDDVVAFRDLNPQAPTHILVIPKKHVGSVDEITDEETARLAAQCLAAAREIAQAQRLSSGYRIVTNTGPDAGQSVGHLHFHLLAGRKMNWPPG